MKRLISTLIAVGMTLSAVGAPSLAVAQSYTGPWVWTDVSSQLTTRTNRPVWAVAYASGNWFYTDGLDLWNTGQVYRYDGYSQTNITVEVRNAGLNRVDDIVSDGQTVLFLQDVVRLDNQLRVVSYRNGQYQNVTNQVRNVLQADEGISSINGENGVWMILTTKARLFKVSSDPFALSEIALPDFVRQNVQKDRWLLYNVNHGSPTEPGIFVGVWKSVQPLHIVPVGYSDWLLIAGRMPRPSDDTSTLATDSTGFTVYYKYANGSFTKVNPFNNSSQGNTRVWAVASNGNKALMLTHISNARIEAEGGMNVIRTFDGTNWEQVNGIIGPCNVRGNVRPCIDITQPLDIAWNGKSWLIVNGNKQLHRIDGTTWTDLGRTKDRFETAAGDNNGRFLLGGALSDTWTNDPTLPITAKLAMVTEGVATPQVLGIMDTVGSNAIGNGVYTSTFGPRMTVNGIPSNFRVQNGGTFTYRVTAEDANGVDHVEIYVNDARIKTCYSTVCEFSNMYWAQGSSQRTVELWARATDRSGNITENSGSPNWLTVEGTSAGYIPPTGSVLGASDSAGSNWTWLEPNQTTLFANQNVAFYVGANDGDGIQRIEIVVNGGVRQTCYLNNALGNQTCATRLFANDYAQGANVFVNAKITDSQGRETWTNSTTLTRANDGSGNNNGNNNGNNANPSVWTSYTPSDTTLYRDQSRTFTANGWDGDGIRRIEILVNGSVKRTCELGTAYGNQTCAATIYANDYTNGTNVSVNAKVTDAFANVSWSDTTTFFRANDGITNPSTGSSERSPAVWEWLQPNTGSISRKDSLDYVLGAWDENGLRSIKIWVNGSVWRTCELGTAFGNQECRIALYGKSFNRDTDVFVNAVAKDAFGNETWSSGKRFHVNAN